MISKLPNVGTSIFTVMSALAQKHQAVNLSQGFPDFEPDSVLVEKVAYYLKKGYHQYAQMAGILPLREAIAQKTEHCYGAKLDPETEITVTSGATEALFAAISAVVRPADEVIVLEPCYDSYIPAIELNGGKVVPISLRFPDFSLDWEQIEAGITHKTRLLIINSPHNPTGSVLRKADLEKLEKIVEKHPNLSILSDEVYEHIIFGQKHESILRYESLRSRSFVISSFGKTYHVTGWKLGYCVAPPALTKEFRKVHQFLTFSSHTPTQWALADYLQEKEPYENLPKFYEQKRNFFRQILEKTPFELLPCEGTYFQLASFRQISKQSDTVFAEYLVKEIGVAVVPVSGFYSQNTDNQVVRFCFAKKEETLEQAGKRLAKL